MKTKKQTATAQTLIARIEEYLNRYVTFSSPDYALPLALWIIGTFAHKEFDAFPYLIITSDTKRSGKTRLSELISLTCHNPFSFSAVTPAVMFRLIEARGPTVMFDEAETLSSEAASTMRAVLNVGYRKGQTIPRIVKDEVVNFPTYCPKVFILIGDTYDTLRDRSIIVTMRRAEAPQRFLLGQATDEGQALRTDIEKAVEANLGKISEVFNAHESLGFLQDREEEIWMPLFSLCAIFCPERKAELSRAAVDIATEKTAQRKVYTQLHEDPTKDAQFAEKLLIDLYGLLLTVGPSIPSAEAVPLLHDIPTAPWRKFRGRGLRVHDIAHMLSRFNVHPKAIAKGSGRGNQTILRGYKMVDVEKAVQGLK